MFSKISIRTNKVKLRVGLVMLIPILLGAASAVFSKGERVPNYTPPGFMEKARLAEEKFNKLSIGTLLGDEKLYVSNYSGHRGGRNFDTGPTVCAIGSLESKSTPEQTSGIQCLKGFRRAVAINNDIEGTLKDVQLKEWHKTETTISQEDWLKQNFFAGNAVTYSYRNDEGLYLDISFSKEAKSFCSGSLHCRGDMLEGANLYALFQMYYKYQNF